MSKNFRGVFMQVKVYSNGYQPVYKGEKCGICWDEFREEDQIVELACKPGLFD